MIDQSGSNFDSPESLAARRAEKEETPRMPETPEEMIAATLDPSSGCIDTVLPPMPLSTKGDPQALRDLLIEIQERLMRYLQIEAKKGRKNVITPSVYAQMITSAGKGSMTTDQLRGLGEVTRHVIAELNPLLHRVWGLYIIMMQTIPEDERAERGFPQTIEEFFSRLEVGRAGDKRVLSFFGIIRELAVKSEQFPVLSPDRAELPKVIDVQDPFSEDQRAYWTEMQKLYGAVFGKELSLPALAVWRTNAVINEVRQLASHTDDEGVKNAAEYIEFWLLGEMNQITDMSDEKFTSYLRNLHFAYGDSDVFIALLDSLRVLKEKAPDLLCRMLGHTVSISPHESRKSDLYGNILHAAFYRSAHLKTREGIAGREDFQNFLDGVTHLDEKQAQLVNISDEEFAQLLQKHIKTPGQAVRRLPSILDATMVAGRQAYMLKKFLAEVSVEGREALLEELRTATPKDFVRLMNSRRLLPRGLRYYQDSGKVYELPMDVVDILKQRDVISVIHGSDLIWLLQNTRSFEKYAFKVNYEKATEGERKLKACLWKTTPSEKLLAGKEFYEFIKGLAGDIKREKSNVLGLLEILEAHADIGKVDWFKWFTLQAGKISYDGLRSSEVAKTLRPIFRSLSIDDLEEPSAFFRLYQFIFDYSSELIAIAKEKGSSLEALVASILETGDRKGFFWFLVNIDDKASRKNLAPPSTEIDYALGVNYALNEGAANEDTLRNLKLLTAFIEPYSLVNFVDLHFARQAATFRPFAEMLSEEERNQFLVAMCKNALGGVRRDLENKKTAQKLIEEGKMNIENSDTPLDSAHVNLMYVLLRECAQAIPDNEEYLDLKNLVLQYGYEANIFDGVYETNLDYRERPIRRVRMDDETHQWLLEEREVVGWRVFDRG